MKGINFNSYRECTSFYTVIPQNNPQEFYNDLLNYLKNQFHIDSFDQTERIWNFIVKSRSIKWRKGEALTVELFQSLCQAFEQTLVGPGLCMPFGGEGEVHAVAEFLLSRRDDLPNLSPSLKKSILISKDEIFLSNFRNELTNALIQGLEHYQKGGVDEEVFRGFVFNILAVIPYTYPKKGERLSIPISTEKGIWSLCEYTMDEKFEMSPSWFSSPMPIYGWIASGKPPILTCLGTTYPGGEGFFFTLISDYTPGLSVGHLAALFGQSEVGRWLEDKKDVQVTGMSLGGALSMHLSRHHPKAIGSVYAFNPAGLYPWNWSNQRAETRYYLYSNENDLVSTMGIFPEGKNVTVYRVLGKKREHFLVSHLRLYFAADQLVMVQTKPEYENRRGERILLTVLHLLTSTALFGILLPFQIVYRSFEWIHRLLTSLHQKIWVEE